MCVGISCHLLFTMRLAALTLKCSKQCKISRLLFSSQEKQRSNNIPSSVDYAMHRAPQRWQMPPPTVSHEYPVGTPVFHGTRAIALLITCDETRLIF